MSEPAAKPSFLQPGNPASDARQGTALGILWLAGAGLSLSVKLKNYWSFTSAAKKGRIPVADDRVNHMAKDLMQRLSMRKNPVLYVSESVSVPITVGLMHPVILLPKEHWLLKDLQMVLHHELIHVKRRDLWYKWIFQFLLCIHWFNPLAWVAFFLSEKDMEMSCDEAVLRRMNGDCRGEYADSLLSLSCGRHYPAAAPPAFGEGDTRGRIKHIMGYRKAAAAVAIVAVALIGILAAVLLASPKKAPIDSGNQEFSFQVAYSDVLSCPAPVMTGNTKES